MSGQDGANDWMDLMSYLIRAIDGSLEAYDAYTVVANSREGAVNENGVEYSFGWNMIFYAKY